MEVFFEKNKKRIYLLIFVLICLNFFAWKEVFYLLQPRSLEVRFLNVGQGDSALIVTPQNHQILVDGGPGSAVLEKLAGKMPFWDRSLDLIILSHPEKDHMQGLIEVLKRYKADYILWTGVKKLDPEYFVWLSVLEQQQKMGAKIIIAQFGQEIRAGGVFIDVLYPFENLVGKELKDTSNDAGVVAKIIYGRNSFLFIGDISIKAENQLINWAGVGDLPAFNVLKSDVLKVAHHGSKYSSSEEFLNAVKPEFAIISVGKNSYGHPTTETLSRLQSASSQIFRTDQQGDILFISNGQNLFLAK
jgi:competence protein ComEC